MQQDENKPRNKDLSNVQLQRLKKLPQFLSINSQEFILYNLVEKQSNSGIFKNERLLILNVKQEWLSYLSKVPPSLIPFRNQAEVNSQQPKERLFTHQTYQNGQNKFTCRMIADKNGIEVKLSRTDRKLEWIYYFGTKQLMEEWYLHIHFLFTKPRAQIDEKYHRLFMKVQDKQQIQEKYDEIPIQKSEVKHQSVKQSNKKSLKQSNQIINSNIHVQDIKHPSNLEKQSDFNEFQQSTPLGKFIKEDAKYKTEKDIQNNKEGKFYYTTPHNEKFDSSPYINSLNPKRQDGQNLPMINSNIKSINGKGLSSNLIAQSRQLHKEQEAPISFRKQPIIAQLDWNSLYYSSNDEKSKVYFDFVRECIQYTTKLVDQLPVSKSIGHFEGYQDYYHVKENGIAYKIAYGVEQRSFIYQLSENSPIICDNYDNYDDLKSDFFDQRQFFFKDAQFQPSLICFIEYKGLSFLCRATKPQGSHEKANKSFKRSNINQDSLLKKMQKLELFIVSSEDFQTIMRYLNTSSLNWDYLYHQTEILQFKIQFLNEMFSEIFVNIIKGELCHLYKSSLFDQFQQSEIQIIEQVVSDSILMLINRLLGKGKESDQLWDLIILQVQRKYKITTSTESIIPGYLLYSVIYKLGMRIRERVSMKTTFILFKKTKAIQKQHVSGWKPRVSCLPFEQMSSLFLQIKENLQSRHENNQQLEMLINNEEYEQIPKEIQYLTSKVNIQLSKTHPYSAQGQNILIYESLTTDTPTQDNYEIVLSAISWLLEAERHNEAFDLAFIKIEELIFWTGKVPIISLIYDSFAEYFVAQDNLEKAIEQLKLSIKTLTEIFGPNDDKLIKKKYELSGYYLNLNRKEDCLKELSECKYLCQSNKSEQGPIYIKILMKMAKLNLFMSKFSDSVTLSMTCLKQLQAKDEDEQIFQSQAAACDFLQVGELLLRSFQLSNRRDEVFQVLSLCAQRCQHVDSLKTYKRLFRMLLFPYLKRLSLKESQMYMMIVQELNLAYKQSSLREQDLYECIKTRKILVDFNGKLKNYFKNMVKLYEETVKRKLLEEYLYQEEELLSKLDKSEVEQFLKETFLVSNLIGIGFVQGMLKDVYYD